MMHRPAIYRGVLLLMLLWLMPSAAQAQASGQRYQSYGAGATRIAFGAERLSAGGQIGAALEAGFGPLWELSCVGSYHPLGDRSSTRVDPFLTAGVMGAKGINYYTAGGLTIGAGTTYWLADRVGLRLDSFAFLPLHNDIRPVSRLYWSVRAGLAFRLR